MAELNVPHLEYVKVPESKEDFREDHFENPYLASAWLSLQINRSSSTLIMVAFGTRGSNKAAVLNQLFEQGIFYNDDKSPIIPYVAEVDPDVLGIRNLHVQVIDTPEVFDHPNVVASVVDQYVKKEFLGLYPNFILIFVDMTNTTRVTENSDSSRLLTEIEQMFQRNINSKINSQYEHVVLVLTSPRPLRCDAETLKNIDSFLQFVTLQLGVEEIFAGIGFDVIDSPEGVNEKYLVLPSGSYCFTSVLEALLSCSSRYGDEMARVFLTDVISKEIPLKFEKFSSIQLGELRNGIPFEDLEELSLTEAHVESYLSSAVPFEAGVMQDEDSIVNQLLTYSEAENRPDIRNLLGSLVAFFQRYKFKRRYDIPDTRAEYMRLLSSLNCHTSPTKQQILRDVLDLHAPALEASELGVGVGTVIPDHKECFLVVELGEPKLSQIGCYLPGNVTGFRAATGELQKVFSVSKVNVSVRELEKLGVSFDWKNVLDNSLGGSTGGSHLTTETDKSKSSVYIYQKSFYTVKLTDSNIALHPVFQRNLKETVQKVQSRAPF